MSNVIIPSTDADKKRIKDCVIEISNSMTRVAAEKAFIKEAILSCCDDVEIDKKHQRKMPKGSYCSLERRGNHPLTLNVKSI